MKAVCVRQFGAIEAAEFTDTPDPVPGPGEVIVAVEAAEVNFPDILVMEGKYQIKPPLPFSPGKAAAGIVETVGDGVTSAKPGDRVAVQVEYGAYAEKLKSAAATCYPMPDGMPFEDAAALGLVYQTAHFALAERAALSAGDSVLVLGASGGIGVASVQLAKALGAGLVIGGVLGDDNAAFAKAAGADHAIDLGMEGLRDGLRDTVRELTDGHGVDIIVDPVGGDANAAALRAMAWRGRMVIIGFASGEIPTIRSNYLLLKNIAVSGLQWSDYRERETAWVARVQEEIFGFWSADKLTPLISRTLPLAKFADALTMLKEGRAQGKIILTVDRSDADRP
jgi:NADPH2:quinone reductase